LFDFHPHPDPSARVPRSLAAALTFFCLCILAAVGGQGCKRKQIQSTPTPSPSPAIAQTQPHQPQTRASQRVTLLIDGSPITFPPVELQLTPTGGATAAQLRTRESNDGAGNAIYFDLTLDDLDTLENLPRATWHFKADGTERLETLNSISLDGRSVVLEPFDVQILFAREAEAETTVEIEGNFRLYDPSESIIEKKIVTVSGRFPVQLK
jgi:hypothetical protein